MRQPWKATGKKSFKTPSSKFKRALTKRGNYLGGQRGEAWKEFTKAVRKRDGNRCRQCKRRRKDLKPGESLQVHHMRRIARGGADHKLNAKTLCSRCHSLQPGHEHMRK